jgi:hypothetical protein
VTSIPLPEYSIVVMFFYRTEIEIVGTVTAAASRLGITMV